MSEPELVFLHIPKTAGSSQNKSFDAQYGVGNVFWWGKNCPPDIAEYPRDLIAGRILIGGHKPLDFYPRSIDPLYCAVVRDPVERAISLFSYNTRPDLAATERDREEREKVLQNMLYLGVDPGNMLESVRQSASLREIVSNSQCQYLSYGEPTFDGVLDSFKRYDFVVGEFASYQRFHSFLGNLLGWPPREASAVNRSRPGYLDEFFSNEELIGLLRELNQEDYKLFEYVAQQHEGLLVNIRDSAIWRKRLGRLIAAAGAQKEFVAAEPAAGGPWPASAPNKLPWPLNSVMVIEERELFYSPISHALNVGVTQMLFELSSVTHKQEARVTGIAATLSAYDTGIVLKDKPMDLARRIIRAEGYFRFAVLVDPMLRLVDFYLDNFVYGHAGLAANPKLMALIADIQGVGRPDLEQGITFRQLLTELVQRRPQNLVLALMPQHLFLKGAQGYRLYRDDELPRLASDLSAFIGRQVTVPGAEIPPTPPDDVGDGGRQLPVYVDYLPGQLREEGVRSREGFLLPELCELASRYYREDYALYERPVDKLDAL